ncbi:MAG: ribosome small subunit-dependent GTPase A [Bacteroidales bacterium]|nr:ribosome small subunit-dependent GTPase A [Bacteroidales bacterium]
MNDLSLYGWNNTLFQQKQSSQFNNFSHGRVSIVHRTCYEVITEEGLFKCELTGNMLYGRNPEEYPCTGDWVIFQPTDQDKGIIYYILPRTKTLYRKKAGTESQRQAIAVHVDKAFIVQSLDANFNVRRIERFMVQILDEGIKPVLVLTKADLGFNEEEIKHSLKHLSYKLPFFITSVHSPEKIDKLRKYIKQGETIVFTGSSGVGKSSLINALRGEEILATSSISDSTGKGRHTSTRREMVLLNNSGILIDSPGVREFGITSDNANVLSSVLNISYLEKTCRYKDCTHTNEPGCSVLEALQNGTLDNSVYESYLKLCKEAFHFSASEQEKRKRDKSFGKMLKDYKKYSQ